ncbi:MAG: hypothetical protein IPO83_03885 [Chitinophagaceae bacterium]|nr:hypothetical protein [Chitinophagaceae bacterium]
MFSDKRCPIEGGGNHFTLPYLSIEDYDLIFSYVKVDVRFILISEDVMLKRKQQRFFDIFNDVISGSIFGHNPGTTWLTAELYQECLMVLLSDARSSVKNLGTRSLEGLVARYPFFDKVFLEFRKDRRYKTTIESLEKLREGEKPSDPPDYTVGPKLPTYQIGIFSNYAQTWNLMGYSRGTLLNSITLAPQEELTIEVFSFDKLKIEDETVTATEFETNSEISSFAKASAQVANESSQTTGANAGVGLGIPIPVGTIPISASINADVNTEIKNSLQNSVDLIHETTRKSIEKIKSTTQVKIVQTHEIGEETRTTRKIRNPNQSRTVTYNYYEVLENYSVTTKLEKCKRFCVLVKNPPFKIDEYFILAYEDRLKKALMTSLYKDGFEAARKIIAQDWFDKVSSIKPEIEKAKNDNASKENNIKSLIVQTATQLKDCLQKFIQVDVDKALRVMADNVNPFVGEDDKPSARQLSKADADFGLFMFWSKFKLVYPGVDLKAADYVDFFAANPNPSDDDAFRQMETLLAGLDDEWLTNLKTLGASILFDLVAVIITVTSFPILLPFAHMIAFYDNNNGLPKLIEKSKNNCFSFNPKPKFRYRMLPEELNLQP